MERGEDVMALTVKSGAFYSRCDVEFNAGPFPTHGRLHREVSSTLTGRRVETQPVVVQ
jgi:hypothetical protein